MRTSLTFKQEIVVGDLVRAAVPRIRMLGTFEDIGIVIETAEDIEQVDPDFVCVAWARGEQQWWHRLELKKVEKEEL